MSLAPVIAQWKDMPIRENGEAFLSIPQDRVILTEPHPYLEQGAVYPDNTSPYMLRAEVVRRLLLAQAHIEDELPGHKIVVFDAYRPLDVQRQMVHLSALARAPLAGLDPSALSSADLDMLVASDPNWAMPTDDARRPPPHSTGGAIDIKGIMDAQGAPLGMGSMPDELSDLKLVDYFKDASDPQGQMYHRNRSVLVAAMEAAGFTHNPREWWHFDFGNQRWAYEMRRTGRDADAVACYGRVETPQPVATPKARP